MSQRIIQTCDRCKIEIPNEKTSMYCQNYEVCHQLEIRVNNSYYENHRNFKIDLCPECENLLFKFFGESID